MNEQTPPLPRTIYHKTKLEVETLLGEYSSKKLSVSVIRMSRCFPERAQIMAIYRLHRGGVDYRDVAEAHILAGQLRKKKDFDIYVVSGNTPFLKSDCQVLYENPGLVIRERHPLLAREFDIRGWKFPGFIDRVYDSSYSENVLGFHSQRGPLEVIKQFENDDFEVLTPS